MAHFDSGGLLPAVKVKSDSGDLGLTKCPSAYIDLHRSGTSILSEIGKQRIWISDSNHTRDFSL